MIESTKASIRKEMVVRSEITNAHLRKEFLQKLTHPKRSKYSELSQSPYTSTPPILGLSGSLDLLKPSHCAVDP